MKKSKIRFLILIFACVVLGVPLNAAQGNAWLENLPGMHRGAITTLLLDSEGRILSAGQDGFLGIWNEQQAMDRFQLSPYSIHSMALRPGRTQIAIIENDENGGSRISAWDYITKENIFNLDLIDSISYINYSARGSFLILAHARRPGVIFVDSDTGQLLEKPVGIAGSVTFAATGMSERVMITYLASGVLSYWDLTNGQELQRFIVPPNINGGVLFGNSRFFAGFDSGGLIVLDAVTGMVFARLENVNRGRIFIDNPESSYFGFLSFVAGRYIAYRMSLSADGNLSTVSMRAMPLNDISSVVSLDEDNVIFGTGHGALWLSNRSGERIMDSKSPEQIITAAASASVIAFISETGALGYIPLDFSLIYQGAMLVLEDTQGPSGVYTHISADRYDSRFLLWHSGQTIPMVKTLRGPLDDYISSSIFIENPMLRHPIRSAAIMNGYVLLLNTAGMLTIIDHLTGEIRFSQSVASSQDAAFVDRDTVIISRSVFGMNTPFLVINISTGETVHVSYPALVGTSVFGGGSGKIYAAAMNQTSGSRHTSIIRIDPSNRLSTENLIAYEGERTSFTMAESGGNFAYSLGREGIILNNVFENIPIERRMALPVRIMDGGRWFVILDGEGGLTWHDNQTGELQAVFRLYRESWVLEDLSYPGSKIIQGPRTRTYS